MKILRIYMEQEVQYSPDKKSLIGTLLINRVRIQFTLALSSEGDELNPVLINWSEKCVTISRELVSTNIKLQEYESKYFHQFITKLAKQFFNRRSTFRSRYPKSKSRGPGMVKFAGETELNVEFCQVLNKMFATNIDIPKTRSKEVA